MPNFDLVRPPLFQCLTIASFAILLTMPASGQDRETFPVEPQNIPQTYQSLWAKYDPRSEPLDVEVLKEWEQDDVVLSIVRYRVGIFKGHKVMVAAIYGHPKTGSELPGLVQIHGGGQYADYRAVIANAKRGYATISISWAGRITAPQYNVSPVGVKLFWDNNVDDPNYRVTTDWGPLDAYHAPHRNPQNSFSSVKPAPWTLDPVDSPRNNPWFLCTLAARRALTFLEQQSIVDANKLGVYGHSMGGKITVMTAGSDTRVQAAAPSCGGISDRENENDNPLYQRTLTDGIYLSHITCPTIFLSPTNDFHGRIGDLPKSIAEIRTDDWRVTCSPQHNHQDTPRFEAATLLWFDQHLKNSFQFPKTPSTKLELTAGKNPRLTAQIDPSLPVESVDFYYTQHALLNETSRDRDLVVNRHWHHAAPQLASGIWTAELPIASNAQPLLAIANVTYKLDSPVTGAGYYYRTYSADSINVSSLVATTWADELRNSEVRVSLKPTTIIESFEGDWKKEWFHYVPGEWARSTHKLAGAKFSAPAGAKLAIDIRSAQANDLIIRLDDFCSTVTLDGDNHFQTFVFSPSDFKDYTGNSLSAWSKVKRLKLSPIETLRPGPGKSGEPRIVGTAWKGAAPVFRNLIWQSSAEASDGG